MTKKKNEILSIEGKEEELEEKQPEKKKTFFSTSDRRAPEKKKSGMLTTRDLDADGKLIKKREARDD